MKQININRQEESDIKGFLQSFIRFSDKDMTLTPNEVKLLSEVYYSLPESFSAERKREVQKEYSFGASYMSQTLTNLTEKGFLRKEKRNILVTNEGIGKLVQRLKNYPSYIVNLSLHCTIREDDTAEDNKENS